MKPLMYVYDMGKEIKVQPIIYVYTENYYSAKRLVNTLYRPAIDKAVFCSEEEWEDEDEYIEVERDTEIYRIFKIRSSY